MGNAWVLRPYPHNIYRIKEFLLDNIIAIGWTNVGNLSGKTREEIKKSLQAKYHYSSNQSIGQDTGNVYRFVNEMKKDEDYVVVPDGPIVFVGKIRSDYYYDATKDNDSLGYPHQREIDWLNDKRAIPRALLTGRVFDSLKGRQTLFATYYEDIADSVENKKHLFSHKNYLDLKQDYLKKLQTGKLIGVNNARFEESVRIIFDRHFPGLTRLSTTNSPVGDTDLKTTLPGGITIRLQVKHFYPEKGHVESWVVEQLANSMDTGDFGIVVTSGTISAPSSDSK